jgi:hypothetical protein
MTRSGNERENTGSIRRLVLSVFTCCLTGLGLVGALSIGGHWSGELQGAVQDKALCVADQKSMCKKCICPCEDTGTSSMGFHIYTTVDCWNGDISSVMSASVLLAGDLGCNTDCSHCNPRLEEAEPKSPRDKKDTKKLWFTPPDLGSKGAPKVLEPGQDTIALSKGAKIEITQAAAFNDGDKLRFVRVHLIKKTLPKNRSVWCGIGQQLSRPPADEKIVDLDVDAHPDKYYYRLRQVDPTDKNSYIYYHVLVAKE